MIPLPIRVGLYNQLRLNLFIFRQIGYMFQENSIKIPILPENNSLRIDFEYSWVEFNVFSIEEIDGIIFLLKDVSRDDVKVIENYTTLFKI